MSVYDSDSSLDEQENFTETNVLLGYASKEASDDTITYLGGRPQWIDPTTPPSATFAKCHVCHDLMVLLLQLNADLPEFFPGHERRLYVWTCRRTTCKRKPGSVRVLRGVRVSADFVAARQEVTPTMSSAAHAKPPINLPSTGLGEVLFGATSSSNCNQNPFSTGDIPASHVPEEAAKGQASQDLATTFAAKLALNLPLEGEKQKNKEEVLVSEQWPQDSEFPPAYPQYYLAEADYEVLEQVEDRTLSSRVMEVDDEGRGGGGGGKVDKVVFESSLDRTFQKFADRLAHNPDQVIRYEFRGQPLLYSNQDTVGKLLSRAGETIPRCGACRAQRVFEVQITPHAISELERGMSSLDGMDWGTIIVGVCERDCSPREVGSGVGYVEEWVGVQWEEVRASR